MKGILFLLAFSLLIKAFLKTVSIHYNYIVFMKFSVVNLMCQSTNDNNDNYIIVYNYY